MMSKFLSIVSLLFNIHHNNAQTTYYCEDAEECASQTIDTTEPVYCYGYDACEDDTITSTDSIYCMGFNGCQESIALTSPDIMCLGFQSCADAQAIVSTDIDCSGYSGCKSVPSITASTIACDGKASCAWAGSLIADTKVTCDGVLSCYDVESIITPEIECYGMISCALINTISASTVTAYGAYALYNTTIDTQGLAEVTLTSWSYLSGYTGVLLCRAGTTTCTISCQGAGCQNLFVYFEGPLTQIQIDPAPCATPANNGIQLGGSPYTTWCPYIQYSSAMTMDEFEEFRQQTLKDNMDETAEAMIADIKERYMNDMQNRENLRVERGHTFVAAKTSSNSHGFVMWSPDNVLIGACMIAMFAFFTCVYAYRRSKEYEMVV